MESARLSPYKHLLLVLLLLAALLPAALRLGSLLGMSDWVELCTAQGMRVVHLQTGEEQQSPEAQAQPCVLCQLQNASAGPPSALPDWTLPERFDEAPAAFLQAPRSLAVWRHALSRGPPTSTLA